MLTDDGIRLLLRRKSEGPNLDYKQGFVWNKANRDKKYELVKDLIAMANTRDGGRVVLGVRDSDFECVGLSPEIYGSIDPSDVLPMAYDNSAPKLRCEVIKHVIDGHNVVVLDVAEFDDVPIICTNTITAIGGKEILLRKGALYVRTAAATTEEVSSPDEMRNLLGRAISKRGDHLLQEIQRLVSGRAFPVEPAAQESYGRELTDARDRLSSKLGPELLREGSFEIVAYPTQYARRIESIPEAHAAIERSSVSLGHASFPAYKSGEFHAFRDGVDHWFDAGAYREGYRFYRSGLFLCRRSYWEDAQGMKSGGGAKILLTNTIIWSLTEFVLFLSRLYDQIAADATIHIEVLMYGCRGRLLMSNGAPFLPPKMSDEDIIPLSEDVQVVQLRASYREIAVNMAKHVFHVFDWMNVTDQTVANMQKQLLRENP